MAKGSGSTRYISPNIKRVSIQTSESILSDTQSIVDEIVKQDNLTTEEKAGKIISLIHQDIKETEDLEKGIHGKSMVSPFKLTSIPDDVSQKYQEYTGTKIINPDAYSSVKVLTHHQGGQKADRGKELSWSEKESIPFRLPKMDIYEHTGALIYTDYDIKVVIQPNQKIKIGRRKTIVANHVSSSKVLSRNEFGNKQYREIKKK